MKYKIWWMDKKATLMHIKLGLPLGILVFGACYFWLDNRASLSEIILIALGFDVFIYALIDFILELPNGFIDEKHDTQEEIRKKRKMIFMVAIVVAYVLIIPILGKYYLFFEQFPGAQFLASHFKF